VRPGPRPGSRYSVRVAVALVELVLVLVVVLVILGGEAPRSVLFAWFRAALRARLNLVAFIGLHSPLQISRLFEAPVPSLFHNDSRAETCKYDRQFTAFSAFYVSVLGAADRRPYHDPMPSELDVAAMLNRFRERARAVRQRGLPPLEGAERKRFMDQARTDYMDYAMIGDATATLDNGILTLTIDLRPQAPPQSGGPG